MVSTSCILDRPVLTAPVLISLNPVFIWCFTAKTTEVIFALLVKILYLIENLFHLEYTGKGLSI